MATQPKKMNIIKQVLTGHKNGLSVRRMAEMYSMSPTTVQRYLKMANEDSLGVDGLLKLEDPELNIGSMAEIQPIAMSALRTSRNDFLILSRSLKSRT